MSGFNPSLLNVFYEEGVSALQQYTPWNILVKQLDDNRYSILQSYADEVLNLK